jgi:hypothetical protein
MWGVISGFVRNYPPQINFATGNPREPLIRKRVDKKQAANRVIGTLDWLPVYTTTLSLKTK